MPPAKPNNPARRPTTYTKTEITGALRSLGYWRWGDKPGKATHIPPEDLVVALMYSRDMRWIYSAIPVVLCQGDFRWSAMAETAKRYGFGGRLRGMIQQLRALGKVPESKSADKVLVDCIPVEPDDLKEVLSAYGC